MQQYGISLLDKKDNTDFQEIIYQHQCLWQSQQRYVDKLTIKIERAINELFRINCKHASSSFNGQKSK